MDSTEEELCYKPVLSKRFTSFAGICKREVFRREFWRCLFFSIIYGLLAWPIIAFLAPLLYIPIIESLSLDPPYALGAFFVCRVICWICAVILWYKLIGIPYYRIFSQRLHAFGKSAIYWLLIPSVAVDVWYYLSLPENEIFDAINFVIAVILLVYFLYLFILCFFCIANVDKVSPIKSSISKMAGNTNTKKRVLKKKKPTSSTVHSEPPAKSTMPVKPTMSVKPVMPVKPVKPIPPNFNK